MPGGSIDPTDAAEQVGDLIDEFGAFSEERRQQAIADLLARHGDERAERLLQAMLLHSDERVFEAAGAGLALLGRLDLLLEAAGHPEARVRRSAANGLARMPDEAAFEALARLATDPDPAVAYRAILDLGRRGERAWEIVIRVASTHPHPRARDAANVVFTRTREETTPFLLQVLQREDRSLWGVALEALRTIPLKEHGLDGRDLLLRILARADTPELRRAAVGAFRKNGDSRAVAAILQLDWDDDPYLQEAAANTLGHLGDPIAFPALVRLMHSNDRRVRTAAVEAIGRLRDPAAVPYLEAALRDPSASIRKAAALSLSHLSGDAGIEALCAALEDADSSVREQAAFALNLRRHPGSLTALRTRMLPGVETVEHTRRSIRHAISSIELSGGAGIALRPTHTGRLVREAPEHSRIGFRPTDVPCTCCGGTCHEIFSVPGEQIGRPGKHYRLVRCADCYFYGPHYVFWENGRPVRAEFDDGDPQEFLEGDLNQTAASIRWEPVLPEVDESDCEWGTLAGPYPKWTQSDEWPYCRTCRLQMEFVFQLSSATLDTIQYDLEVGNGFFMCLEHYATLYYFICEDCNVTATVSQCT